MLTGCSVWRSITLPSLHSPLLCLQSTLIGVRHWNKFFPNSSRSTSIAKTFKPQNAGTRVQHEPMLAAPRNRVAIKPQTPRRRHIALWETIPRQAFMRRCLLRSTVLALCKTRLPKNGIRILGITDGFFLGTLRTSLVIIEGKGL